MRVDENIGVMGINVLYTNVYVQMWKDAFRYAKNTLHQTARCNVNLAYQSIKTTSFT